METILCGNFQVDLIDDIGGHVERVSVQPQTHTLFRRRFPPSPAVPEPLGRQRHITEAVNAIRGGVPIEFHGPCGVGKSTLLRYIAAAADVRIGAAGIYLQVAEGEAVGDVLQRLALRMYAPERPVKLTREQCVALLNQARAVVALDDIAYDRDEMAELLLEGPGTSPTITDQNLRRRRQHGKVARHRPGRPAG
ncbi:hypothetical protein [Dactylosporangium sp. CA-092794]|uniref:hypothetical protein n=1 Tax=Dactylosporangium sp. CA-092794 TaxID=3239929 RepID=UPI003D8F7ECE